MNLCILDARTLGSDIDLSGLKQFGTLVVYDTTKPEEVSERIADQDIVITNKVILNESNMKEAERLRLICITATGTNNIDLEYARSRGILVANVAGYSTPSVVQHTFTLLFYLAGHTAYYDSYVKSGNYVESTIFTHIDRPFFELKDKVWGIIGLGAIGRSVASVASAFGCKVVYYSTSGKNYNTDYERADLDALLKTSDVVSIHAPLNAATKGLIGYEQLKQMKSSALLLNLGRGGIVNEADLATALNEKLIAGAGLDVLENEPMKEGNPLLGIKDSSRLVITPHIAWASVEARKRLVNEVVENIKAFIQGTDRNRVC